MQLKIANLLFKLCSKFGFKFRPRMTKYVPTHITGLKFGLLAVTNNYGSLRCWQCNNFKRNVWSSSISKINEFLICLLNMNIEKTFGLYTTTVFLGYLYYKSLKRRRFDVQWSVACNTFTSNYKSNSFSFRFLFG